MRAVMCREHGEIDALQLEEVAPPPLVAGGVRVTVHAAGVGFANLLVIQGRHQNKPPLPFSPGTEVAGIVAECADDVTTCTPGDRVVAGVEFGGYAEEVVALASNVFPIPETMPFEDAVHFPSIYATAYGALLWRAALTAGEYLLILGAAGASGLAAIEIGRVLQAKIIAVVSTEAKAEASLSRGADHAVILDRHDFRERILEITDGKGVNAVFDPVGGDAFDHALRVVAPGARMLVIGFAAGRIPQIPANLLLVKNVTVSGLNWGYYMGWGKTKATAAERQDVREAMAEMCRWHSEGRLHPLTDARYKLADFASALRSIAERRNIGKPVLLPRG